MSVNDAEMRHLLRRMANKRPIVADWDRELRCRWHRRTAVAIWRLVLRSAGRKRFVQIKWRWLRGLVRDRRLYLLRLWLFAKPLTRPVNYSELGRMLIDIQPLPPGAKTIVERS